MESGIARTNLPSPGSQREIFTFCIPTRERGINWKCEGGGVLPDPAPLHQHGKPTVESSSQLMWQPSPWDWSLFNLTLKCCNEMRHEAAQLCFLQVFIQWIHGLRGFTAVSDSDVSICQRSDGFCRSTRTILLTWRDGGGGSYLAHQKVWPLKVAYTIHNMQNMQNYFKSFFFTYLLYILSSTTSFFICKTRFR